MTIIQQPGNISLSGNMLPFIINSGALVNFTLKDGADVLIQSTYEPDATGMLTIDVKDIIESRLKYNIKGDAFYEQTEIVKEFTAKIDDQTIVFKAIRCGVRDLADTPLNWLTGNFLTWQPQQKGVVYYSPEWLTYYAPVACNIQLKAYIPGEAEQNSITIGSCQAGKAFTFNMQYAHITGLLGSKYPTHYDVWAENSAGVRLNYIQRYYYSEVTSEQEQWFPFENSLGGLDCLRATGETDFNAENEHKLALVDGQVQEYKIDTKKIYSKNTGHLESYERQWLQDFATSKNKYIYHAGAIRKIAVTESPFNYAVSDSPTDFTFKYRFTSQSSLLNLIRSEHLIPSSISIPDIDAPDFFLPPRLSEFPRVELGEDVIIPAFSPNSETPTVTTVGQLFGTILSSVLAKIPGAEGGGQLINILLEHDILPATDKNVFSSLRSLKEIGQAVDKAIAELDLSDTYLSKVKADVAQKLIKFLEGIETDNFTPGLLTGTGAKIDALGNAEFESAKIRSLLEVPEFRFNKTSFIGDETFLTEYGILETVEHIEGRVYKVYPKLLDGEFIEFVGDDLIKGVFHDYTSDTKGFATSCLRVDEVGQTFMKVTLVADADTPSGYNLPPQNHMRVARVGNVTVKDRQRYVVLSSKKGGMQIYDGASDFKSATLVASFDTAQDFKNKFSSLPLKEGLPYAYLAGLVVEDIIRVDYQGKTVREIYDRGPHEEGKKYFNNNEKGTDDVWLYGCRWRCFSYSTTATPSWSSPEWTMIEGRSDVRMEFDSSNGLAFFAGAVDTVITPVVFIGNANVSTDIVEEQWSWKRESGHEASDIVWNAKHKGVRQLHLSNEDMGSYWSKTNPVRFICTAIYPASSINTITNYIEL